MRLEGQQLGNYHVIRLLDEGGMGQVYLARDTKLPREVAIKVMREDSALDPALQGRFQREMQMIAMLRHPRILPVYMVDEHMVNGSTIRYMVMPYMREGSLAQWLEQRQKRSAGLPSPLDVVYLVQQATEALQYAHDKNILHRDIKPSNFLIDDLSNPDRPSVLLADFGLVKDLQDGQLTSTGLGTPYYMAPELSTEQPTPASDQYALAIMTYELLTGQVPFQGGYPQLLFQHRNTPPQPPGTLNPHVSKATDAVLLRALAKKPAERYPSIKAYCDALQQSAQKQAQGKIQRTEPVAKPTPTPKPAKNEPVKVARNRSASLPTFPPLLRPAGDSTATLALSRREAMTGGLKPLTVMDGMNTKKIRLRIPEGVAPGESLRFPLPDVLDEGHVLHVEDPNTSALGSISRSLAVTFQVTEPEQVKSSSGKVIAIIVIIVLIALALFIWAWTTGVIPHR